jgi:IPT/TIG domain/Cysteine-rich secretory protein family
VSGTSKRVFGALANAILRSPARRRLGVSVLGALAISFLPAFPSTAQTPVQIASVPASSPGWLNRLNTWRVSTGVSALTENTTWTAGDYNHAIYMVRNDLVTHYETAGVPYYTAAGDTAARNGNIQVSSTTSSTDDQAIDWWMEAPFHAMAMMDPRLTQTAFGSYRLVKSGWQEGATLDTSRGNPFTGGRYPVYFPGNGSGEPLTTYSGGESPNPLQACSGYAAPTGLPVFIEVGGNVSTTAGAVHSFTGNGVALAHCVIDSSNAALSSYLRYRGGVIVVPKAPLKNGVKYVVALTVNGTPYTWSFTVGPFLASVTSVSPNAGSTAGGTAVTISGSGFSNGATGVKFGTTAAVSFSVVNDTTITAVSPAHAFGAVDVTVTTATGTSPASSRDRFTYGACTSVSDTAVPASPSFAGTTVAFTASASGCADASPLYQFLMFAPGGSAWQIVQPYSNNAVFSWSTVGKALGTYKITVWAKDALSGGTFGNVLGTWDTSNDGAHTLTQPACTAVTNTAAPLTSAPSGTVVAFTAVASGCTNAGPQYQFWTFAPGATTWQIVQPYSPNGVLSWRTTGMAAGIYKITVWVRDAGSTRSWDATSNGTYTLTSTPCTSVSAGAAPLSPSTLGTPVTISAVAAGCPNARYQFWMLAPGSTTWTIVQAYGPNPQLAWSTTNKPKGTYRISIWVRDATSAGTYGNVLGRWDASSDSTYTLS